MVLKGPGGGGRTSLFSAKKNERTPSKAVLGFIHFATKLFKNISFIFSLDSVG